MWLRSYLSLKRASLRASNKVSELEEVSPAALHRARCRRRGAINCTSLECDDVTVAARTAPLRASCSVYKKIGCGRVCIANWCFVIRLLLPARRRGPCPARSRTRWPPPRQARGRTQTRASQCLPSRSQPDQQREKRTEMLCTSARRSLNLRTGTRARTQTHRHRHTDISDHRTPLPPPLAREPCCTLQRIVTRLSEYMSACFHQPRPRLLRPRLRLRRSRVACTGYTAYCSLLQHRVYRALGGQAATVSLESGVELAMAMDVRMCALQVRR